MLFMVRPDTKAVHLLADLLETIEVTADELMDLKFAGQELATLRAMSDHEIEVQLSAQRAFVSRVRSLELAIIAKLGQARDKARAVSRTDWRLRPIMMLFTSGTQAFTDQFEAGAGNTVRAFDGAHQIFPYLRSRGLVPPLMEHYDGSVELIVTDSFRLMGALPLRDLRERCEATLNALDAHYDLYDLEDDAAEEALATVAQTEPAGVTPPLTPIVNFGHAADMAPAAPLPSEPVVQALTQADIDAANDASEAGLKGLTERLADLKADAAIDPLAAAPVKAASAA